MDFAKFPVSEAQFKFFMKRFLLLAVAGLMAGAASLMAQPPQGPEGAGNLPQMPKILTPEEKTAQQAEKYSLTEEQKAALLELNKEYDGKLEFRMQGMEQGAERRDFRNMSDAERQEFFSKMQEQMADMQERQQQMQKDQKAYDNAIKNILDKKQLKAYRADRRKEEADRQRAMQQFGGGMPGGPGGFPGGPGGFPGGPGGFPGGGFPGGF